MPGYAQVGDYCPNKDCPDYGKPQADQPKPNIIKHGKSREGRQRYKCKTCKDTFCETAGTLFHGKRTAEEKILEALALVAEGTRISSISRVKGFKEDTILRWLREAGRHAEVIEEVLMAEYHLGRGQLDGLWSYVGNKGEKKPSRDR